MVDMILPLAVRRARTEYINVKIENGICGHLTCSRKRMPSKYLCEHHAKLQLQAGRRHAGKKTPSK